MISSPPRAHDLRAHNLGDLAEFYAANPGTWPVRPEFRPEQRWYARLCTADDHEAWLLTWLPGQATDLHDHGGASGAFHVLQGQLTEQTPTDGTVVRLDEHSFGPRRTRSFDHHHVHRIVNLGNTPAISLHVYAPVLAQMTRYQLTGGALRITAIERAGEDW